LVATASPMSLCEARLAANCKWSADTARILSRCILPADPRSSDHVWTIAVAPLAIHAPHITRRHDACCRGAGDDRVAAVTTTGLAVRLCFSIAEQTDRTDGEQQESRWLGAGIQIDMRRG